MARRINTSQLESKLRQLEQKKRRAINDYKRAVRNHNAQVKKTIDAYNRFVREYNSAVRRNKQIISCEIRKLNTSSHSTFTVSVRTMQGHYTNVSSVYTEGYPVTPEQDAILDLVESEQANSIITANAIENDEIPEENTEDKEIGNKLRIVSEDLDNRWKGAVYALNPNCAKTERGNATRKEKIKYMMRDKKIEACVMDFADADIDNILELFHVLSDGTHGAAGRYAFSKLLQVKKRVEQGINFLCTISA